MALYEVQLRYTTSVTVEVDAKDYDDAVEQAKVEIKEGDYLDTNDLDFEAVDYAMKI